MNGLNATGESNFEFNGEVCYKNEVLWFLNDY